jgi:fatty acid desaturase
VGQHRLIMLGHEASHYLLFRNRLLNELASGGLCMYPILSVTQNYRLQHLAHHQYVNDPARDPDLHFMEASGQRCRLPLPGGRLVWECVVRPLLWLPGLLRYLLVRARHTTVGGGPGPYQSRGPRSSLLVRVGGVYLLTLALGSQALAWWGNPWLLAAALTGLWALAMTFYALVPGRFYPSTGQAGDFAAALDADADHLLDAALDGAGVAHLRHADELGAVLPHAVDFAPDDGLRLSHGSA